MLTDAFINKIKELVVAKENHDKEAEAFALDRDNKAKERADELYIALSVVKQYDIKFERPSKLCSGCWDINFKGYSFLKENDVHISVYHDAYYVYRWGHYHIYRNVEDVILAILRIFNKIE